MAQDQFQTGVCSSNLWNHVRTSGFAGSTIAVPAAAGSAVSFSTGVDDMVDYVWMAGTETADGNTRSCEDSSTVPERFQDTHHKVDVPNGLLIDPSFPVTAFGLPSPTVDWSHDLLSGGSDDHQSTFQTILQEDLTSKPYFPQDSAADNQLHLGVTGQDMNQAFIVDQHHLGTGNGFGDTTVIDSFPIVSASTSTFFQGMFESVAELKPRQQYGYDHGAYCLSSNDMNHQQNGHSSLSSKFPQTSLLRPSMPLPSPPKQQHQVGGGLQYFSNNVGFWNAPAAASVEEPRPGLFPPMQTQFSPHVFESKSNNIANATVTTQSNRSDGSRETSTAAKKGGNEPAFKKSRVDTPSPLPTFKVRKEKLSDRITALQQLVSPFGKTDTASVLYEAIEYIKFLHEQVNVLCTPYLKNGQPIQHQPRRQQQNSDKSTDGEGPKHDLRSRGLCLVPSSSTFPVVNEPTADIWNPTFGGSYR